MVVQRNIEGKLEVKVVSGQHFPRRTRLGKQDCVVELGLGTSTKRTQVNKSSGNSPKWEETLYFTVSGLGKGQLTVRAIVVDTMVGVKEIGSCVVDLARIFEEEEDDAWHSLKYKDKPAGEVYLELTFTPKGGRKKQPKHLAEEEEEEDDPQFQTEPKLGKSSSALATAPDLPPAPFVGLLPGSRPQSMMGSVSSAQTMPVNGSGSSLGAIRPSMADLRPYSSASMYNAELAIKYANKHGKKPLPAAPSPLLSNTASMTGQGSPVPSAIGIPQQYQQQQQQMYTEYDQTMLPGQFSQPVMQPPHQQQQQNGSFSLPMALSSAPPMSSMSMQPPYQQQQPQPHQQQSLVSMFAPPQQAAATYPTNQNEFAYSPNFQTTEQLHAQSLPNKMLPAPPPPPPISQQLQQLPPQQQQQQMMMMYSEATNASYPMDISQQQHLVMSAPHPVIEQQMQQQHQQHPTPPQMIYVASDSAIPHHQYNSQQLIPVYSQPGPPPSDTQFTSGLVEPSAPMLPAEPSQEFYQQQTMYSQPPPQQQFYQQQQQQHMYNPAW